MCGMDRSVGKSQEINLSVSTSTLTHGGHATANPNNPAEFVNHGLHLWNQIREQWIGHKKLVDQPQQLREPKLNWNATYDSLFGSNKPLPEPIPLAVSMHNSVKRSECSYFCLNDTTNAHVKRAGNGRFPNGFLGAGRTV